MSGRTGISVVQWVANRPLAVLLLLACLATLIYSNTFSASFHFDDNGAIANNSQIKHLSVVRDVSQSRYVGLLSFALNYRIGGLTVGGYHVVNLFIHIINGFLVYTLVLLLVKTQALNVPSSPLSTSWSRSMALMTALLFVTHPIQTQAVTYIVQRFASLAALFYLLAVVCYLQWRLAEGSPRSRYAWYAGAMCSTILAMKTKEISFTLPVMLFVVESVFFQAGTRRRWMPLVPFLATLLIIPLSLPAGMGESGSGFARESTEISRLSYLLTQFRVIMTYLRLLVFPVHQNLDYDYPIRDSLLDPPVFLSLLVLLAIAGMAVYLLFSRPRYRLVGFGLAWFFVTLSVESSIIPIRDVIFEHRLYLPSVGMFLAGIALITGFRDRLRATPVLAIAGTVVVVCAVATYNRNAIWHDDLTLWRHVVAESPMKARPHTKLGTAYLEQGRLDDAVAELTTAVQLDPQFPTARLALGKVYVTQGRLDDAIKEFATAVQINPAFFEAHTSLGYIYTLQGRPEQAYQELATAIQLDPKFADARNNLGRLYLRQGRLDEAIKEIMIAVHLNPDSPEAHGNLGTAYAQQGRLDLATPEYVIASRLAPHSYEAHDNLGYAYARQGKIELAATEFLSAVRLKPDDAQAHSNLGNVYAQQGRQDLATQEYLTAIQLNPNYAVAHNNLGTIYLQQRRLEESAQELSAAIQLNPDYVEAHANLGMVYKLKGLESEARTQFETVLRIQPDFLPAQRALKLLDTPS